MECGTGCACGAVRHAGLAQLLQMLLQHLALVLRRVPGACSGRPGAIHLHCNSPCPRPRPSSTISHILIRSCSTAVFVALRLVLPLQVQLQVFPVLRLLRLLLLVLHERNPGLRRQPDPMVLGHGSCQVAMHGGQRRHCSGTHAAARPFAKQGGIDLKEGWTR